MITPIVAALVEVLLKKSIRQEQLDKARMEETAAILQHKIEAMPVVLRTAMTVLTHVFNWYGLLMSGRFFNSQDVSKRERQIHQWQKSPVGLCREFIGFYEKMTMFIYYSLCPIKI